MRCDIAHPEPAWPVPCLRPWRSRQRRRSGRPRPPLRLRPVVHRLWQTRTTPRRDRARWRGTRPAQGRTGMSTAAQYRAKQYAVEAIQFNGLDDYMAIVAWMKESGDTYAL